MGSFKDPPVNKERRPFHLDVLRVKHKKVCIFYLIVWIVYKIIKPISKIMFAKFISSLTLLKVKFLLTCLLVLGNLANRWPLRSNNLICLLSCGIATIPVLETASRLAALSPRIVAKGLRIFRNSHIFTLRSSEPETILSSRVKTADVTVLWLKKQ